MSESVFVPEVVAFETSNCSASSVPPPISVSSCIASCSTVEVGIAAMSSA